MKGIEILWMRGGGNKNGPQANQTRIGRERGTGGCTFERSLVGLIISVVAWMVAGIASHSAPPVVAKEFPTHAKLSSLWAE